MKKLHPMGKVYDRAMQHAYIKCGLSKDLDMMYFDMVVNAFLAGYKSAMREQKKSKEQ